MNREDCYELGYIEKSHGLSGDVQVFLDVDFPEEYTELESVFVELNSRLVPFFIEKIQSPKKSRFIVHFEDVSDKDAANKITGCKLWLPLSTLPQLEGDDFYYHEIVGFKVVDKTQGDIGAITSVYNSSNQDIAGVDYQGAEVLVPLNDNIIISLDRENETLNVNLPEGLIEVYTSEQEPDDAD